MKQLNLIQNTPEWLAARENYKTASEAAIVLGISPFQTVENFKAIKLGLKQQYYSAAMRQGHDLEDTVRHIANEHFGKTFAEECWVEGEYMASLDGRDGDVLVELKVSPRTYDDLKAGVTPAYYECQVQQQLYCSPAKVGYLLAYNPKNQDYAVSNPIEPDPGFIDRITTAWEAFELVQPPEVIDRGQEGSVIELFDRYEICKQTADDLKQEMQDIKAELIELANDVSIQANGYKLTKGKPRVSYDYRQACQVMGIDLEPFQKESDPSWTITIPKSPFDAQ